MLVLPNSSDSIGKFYYKVEQTISNTLCDTGYGGLQICSKLNKGKRCVQLRASTYYDYEFDDNELKRWLFDLNLNSNYYNRIDEFYSKLKIILSHTWKETGYGHIAIDCERVKSNLLAIKLLGSTHYIYKFSDEDFKQWLAKR